MKSQQKVRSLYFEKIFWWHYPIVILAYLLKWKVFAFDTDLNMKQKRVLLFLLEKGLVNRIIAHHYSFGTSHTQAIESSDLIVDAMSSHMAIKSAINLYKDSEVMLVFKRSLAEKLAVLFSIQNYFETSVKESSIWFVPSSYCAHINLLQNHHIDGFFPENVSLFGSGSLSRMTDAVLGSFKWFFVIVVYGIYFGAQFFRKVSLAKKYFKYGLSLSSPWFEKFKGGPREFTFLVDDKYICKNEAVFLVEYPNANVFFECYRKLGFHLCAALSLKKVKHIFESNILIASEELKHLGCLFLYSWRQAFIRESVMTLLSVRLTWGRTLSTVSFKNYVYSNKENKNQIALNIFFRGLGIQSWSFSQFVGGPYQVDSSETFFDSRNVYWSFLNSDYFMLNCDAMADSMRKHYQAIRHYKVIGNIFSEMIVGIDQRVIREKILADSMDNIGVNKNWVSVFDTSYVDLENSYSNYEEAACFLRDLIKLAEAYVNLVFVFKPSKDISYFVDSSATWSSPTKGRVVVELRQQLASLSNVIMLDDSSDPVEVVAASNVVITNCFSSPTADALSASIPAFWYDSAGLTKGYPLDEVKGLVAHGYSELNSYLNKAFEGGFIDKLYKQKAFCKIVNESPNSLALHNFREDLNAG